MGDGIINRYALIINGDTEQRHIENVDRSVRVLRAEGYETFVLSTSRARRADHYAESTVENIQKEVDEISGKIDDDDELVIYTTGHGGPQGVCLPEGCDTEDVMDMIDIQTYGKRTIVMDQCFAGNWNKIYLDDPRTLFITAGSRDETVCCSEFAPYFWAADVPDINGDGTVSWQERYANAFSHVSSSYPQFIASADYLMEGSQPFPAEVRHIDTMEDFMGAMSELKPGQYAIVDFSMEGCPWCRQYAPMFEDFARQADGQYLFLETESEEIADAFEIDGFPKVVVFNSEGERYVISDREAILAELGDFNVPRGLHPEREPQRQPQSPLSRIAELLQEIEEDRARFEQAERDLEAQREAYAESMRQFYEDETAKFYFQQYGRGRQVNPQAQQWIDDVMVQHRQTFSDPNTPFWLREGASEVYSNSGDFMSGEEATQGIEAYSRFFMDPDDNVRRIAIGGFVDVVLKNAYIDREVLRRCLSLFKATFSEEDDIMAIGSTVGYELIFDILTPDEREAEIAELEAMASNPDLDDTTLARVRQVLDSARWREGWPH
jgi:thiol-disulfide isomerase/thioredoxin